MRAFSLFSFTAALLLPAQALAVCANPAGVAGQIVFNTTYNVPQYCDDTNWIAMVGGDPVTGGGDYIPNAVTFDLTDPDYLTLSSDLTGVTDSKIMTGSYWFRANSDKNQTIFMTPSINVGSIIFTGGNFRIGAVNSSSTQILRIDVAGVNLNDGDWHHIAYSVDLSDPGKRHIYIDDIAQSLIITDYIDDLIDHTQGTYSISQGSSAYMIDGDLADGWYSTNQYIDFSIEENRRKFINASGNPVYLGADGSIPTGTSPDIFLSGNTANWHTNKGTGGGFTENGTLSTAATTPYIPRTKVVPSGLVGHWRLDETSGSTIFDSSGNGNNGTWSDSENNDIAEETTTGLIGQALGFEPDAVTEGSDAVQIGSPAILDNLGPMSVCLWAKTLGSTFGANSPLVTKTGASFGQDGWELAFNRAGGEKIFFVNNEQGWKQASAGFARDTWQHVCATWDGTDGGAGITIYQNGVDAGTQSTGDNGTTVDDSSYNVNIGWSDASSTLWEGHMDDVRIYNRELSQQEVIEIYKAKDGIRYNESMRTMEYFDGNQFVSMTPSWSEPATSKSTFDCQNIGDVCSDGTVRAGTSPDGNIAMYTTRCELGQTWDGSTCTGSSSNITWNASFAHTDYTVSGATNSDDGDGNTALLLTVDADGTEPGVQPHDAAVACDTLVSDGHSDWYLPARNELWEMYDNRTAIGNFTNTQTWSSTESGINSAFRIDFSSGSNAAATKNGSLRVRCVRKSDLQLTGSGNLVGHWKLDETSGTTAVDSSGNGNDGTMNSHLETEEDSIKGAVGTALHFKNKNPTISNSGLNAIINTPDLLTDTDNATLAAWIYPERTANTAYMRLFGGNGWIAVVQTNNTLHYTLSGGAALVSSAVFQDSKWNHFALTYNASTKEQKIFINGVEDASQTDPAISFTNFLTRMSHTFNGYEGGLDDVRLYNRVLSATEITQLYQMGTPVGSSTALPQGCPNVGEICDDGSVYTGLSPDGSVAMFTTTIELETTLPFNNGNATDFVLTSTSGNSGETNTNTLVTTDSDSATAGFQTHQAAQYCYDLNAYGADDWYLPSTAEYNLILPAIYAIGDYTTLTTLPDYHSSNELDLDDSSKRRLITTTGALDSGSYPKEASAYIRCARKGPAPRCANPYGLEGQMIYNTNGNVVQYCDGARWIAIGKYGP